VIEFDVTRIIQAYDARAEERDQEGLSERKATHIKEAMAAFKANGVESILEIGSGPGNAAQLFQRSGHLVECVDVSPRMIELVERKGITGWVLDFRKLASLNRTYDAVFSINSLLHLPSDEFPAVLESISSILGANGLFVLGLWGGDDHEGIMQEDRYEPKRYFVFYGQQTLLSHLTAWFWIEEYRREPLGKDQFFHKVILRKR